MVGNVRAATVVGEKDGNKIITMTVVVPEGEGGKLGIVEEVAGSFRLL